MNISNESHKDVCHAINEQRLWDRHQALARHGGLPNGGVDRQALTSAEAAARKLLATWADDLGFQTFVDGVGNFFVRREGADASAAPILMGSHIDTTPTGGKFDGAYGVLAALEVMQALEECAVPTQRALELVVWANEEGCRFGPGQMGAAVFTGSRKLDQVLATKDAQGTTVAEALEGIFSATPKAARRECGFPVAAFLEAHIEQGPELEAVGKIIGAVTGIQGRRSFRVTVTGEAAHAGTMKQSKRRDAVLAAVDIIAALRQLTSDAEDMVRFTVGELHVTPNAPLVVPAKVMFTVDVRHPHDPTMKRIGDQVARTCSMHAGPCAVEVEEYAYAQSVTFTGEMIGKVEQAADALNLPYMRMLSYAGHDSRELAKVCPTAMIFVPSEQGISHNAMENTKPEHLAAGARVLAFVARDVAQSV